MDHLDRPSSELWRSRRQWFESQEERARGEASYLLSEQACALAIDVQACFCAGAWVAVVVIAMTVVDSSLRETEVPQFKGNTKRLLDRAKANPDLQRLRRRRNALVHLDPTSPAITVAQQWSERHSLEADARKAVKLMFEAFYIGPWV